MVKSVYSLWFIPENRIGKILNKTILSLSGKYRTPSFKPHITLLGSFECQEKFIIEKTQNLAAKLKPLKLSFGKIEFSTTYWQCVFVRVHADAKLMEAHLKAKQIFNVHKDDVYMPHVSLFYGDLNRFDMAKRARIAKEVRLPAKPFVADRLALVPSDPNPAKWKHLEEIKLHE